MAAFLNHRGLRARATETEKNFIGPNNTPTRNDFSPEAKARRTETTRRWYRAHAKPPKTPESRAKNAERQRERRATHPGEASAIGKKGRQKAWGDDGLTVGHKYSIAKKLGGVSLYEAMFAAQKGVCAICQKHQTGTRYKTLCVDHDHSTNQIRGLLCNNCNRAIGLLKDDVALLQSAIVYIKNGGS